MILISSCNQENPIVSVDKSETLPYYNEASFTPHWIAEGSPELSTFHRVSEFELINQFGESITEKDLEGKITVVDFFFTSCPGICPKMTANMSTVQNAFLNDKDVLLMSHSVTPKIDLVPILKDYADSMGVVKDKWHLLTGSREEIYNLGRNTYFVEEDLGVGLKVDDFLHTENFVLIDKNGHIRGIYNGLNKTSIQQLIEDIDLLKEL